MPALRIKVAAQDAALRALRTAASAEPNKDVSVTNTDLETVCRMNKPYEPGDDPEPDDDDPDDDRPF